MTQRILIIDDDAHVRLTLQTILSRTDIEIRCALDGAEGLQQFRAWRPDLIITDIIMPDQDGVSIIGSIKREAPQTRVVAISGGGRIGNADMLKRARDAGADHILPKPFAMSDLLAVVRGEN